MADVLPLDDNFVPVSSGVVPNSPQRIAGLHLTNLQGPDSNGSYCGDLVISGTVTATNPSVGTDGSGIPTSSTLVGASDGTNLQQLLVESASNRNLRIGVYSGANEATVTGANALKVDNSAVTQPVSGAVTANAGTNLNTSLLALESGGHLATIDTSTAASKTDLDTIVTNTNKIPASPAQEGGNLATIATNTTSIATAANQTTGNTSLATIATNTTGVATAANQSTANTSLASIATNTGRIPSVGQTTMSASQPVVIASNQSNVPINVAQVNGQTPIMTVDSATAANTQMITAGLFNGTTVDRWREILADGASGLGIGSVMTYNYDGSGYNRTYGNLDNISLLASAARTTTQTVADQTNFNSRGVIIVLDMTNVGASPSVTLEIDGKDPVSGKYYSLLTGAAVTTVSTNVYTVYPGSPATANVSANTPLPKTWRVKVTANNANSGTYSVGASLIL